MKERKLNNKGFSLVELIIVIAIMVILVVVIAPQYLKFVNNSRVSADVQTAQTIATAIDTAVADNQKPFGSDSDSTTVDWSKVSGADTTPASKFGADYTFVITGNDKTGVKQIVLKHGSTSYQCYPNPDATADPKGINNLSTAGGLKQ